MSPSLAQYISCRADYDMSGLRKELPLQGVLAQRCFWLSWTSSQLARMKAFVKVVFKNVFTGNGIHFKPKV
jgi:hypothetical protein